MDGGCSGWSLPWCCEVTRDLKLSVCTGLHGKAFSSIDIKSQEQERKLPTLSSALPETAASVAIAATVVGAAATLLVRRTKGSEETEVRYLFLMTHKIYIFTKNHTR